MPRLLILCEYPTLLGGERSMLATLDAVRGEGFDVHVAAPPEGSLAKALRDRGVPHVRWQVQDADGQRLSLEQLREGLASLIASARPELLHANSLSTARIAGPVAANERVPSIGHLRDIVKLSTQANDDLKRHRRLIAVSHATRDFHVAQGIDATTCIVVHNGVDLREFQPREPMGYLHRELQLAADARLVATIGQIGLRKGTDVALAAMARVMAHHADVHWLLIGQRTSGKEESRELERRLRRAAAQPPLAGRVHFLGNRDDVPRLMNECVLLVHVARQEPLGRVLLEAAACGIAVVASDAGGTREIFPREADGAVLVPIDDAPAIAVAVGALLTDEKRRQALGAGARRRAEAAFDIRGAAARLIKQYREVLGC